MAQLVKVAQKKDIPLGQGKAVEVQGKRIALFHVDNKFYAIDDECTHAGGTLSEGSVEGTKVICPWHSAEFDIKTGDVLAPPAFERVKSYKVEVDGEDISLEI